jgi:hypothetical protein
MMLTLALVDSKHAASKGVYMRNAYLLLQMGLILFSMNMAFAVAQSTKQKQISSVEMQSEIDELANRFLESLIATGNLRKVDSKLLHPLFTNPPCALIPIVERNTCLKLSPEDRQEYKLAESNIIWLNEQLLILLPPSDAKELFSSRVSPELNLLTKRYDKLQKPVRSMEDFRELASMAIEVEKTLLAKYLKISDPRKRTIRRFFDSLDVAPMKDQEGVKPKLSPYSIDELPEAFEYEKKDHRFLVAKDRGVFKVVQFSVGGEDPDEPHLDK